jgi:hypothetical protein
MDKGLIVLGALTSLGSFWVSGLFWDKSKAASGFFFGVALFWMLAVFIEIIIHKLS